MLRQISQALALFPAIAMLTLAGCGGSDDSAGGETAADAGGAARQDTRLVDACQLIERAELETMLGASVGRPTVQRDGFDDDSPVKRSLCSYSGENDGIVLKVTYPYRENPGTSAEWAAKVRKDYTTSLEVAEDPEALAMLGNVQVHPLEGLGGAAAWIDLREVAGQVVVHTISEGSQRTYLELYATDLDTGRAYTEKLLAALP
ncbi:MAG TPA: hypothetical protein VK939_18325 [Longimicrobiales bacterium]|nr:hypothetical protein [Longimicrobiales bacterium]